MGNFLIEEFNKPFNQNLATEQSGNTENISSTIPDVLQKVINIDMQSLILKYDGIELLSGVINEVKKYLKIE